MKTLLILFSFIIFFFGSSQSSQYGDTLVYKSDTLNYVIINYENTQVYYEFKDDYKIKNGKSIDEFRVFRTIYFYSDNQKNGEAFRYVNNKLSSKVTFKNGILDGPYYDCLNDDLFCFGKYKKGLRVGKWIYKNTNTSIAKGRYSGRKISTVMLDKSLGFIDSKGDTLSFKSVEDYTLFTDQFDYYIEGGSTWLRKGKWIFFDSDNNVVWTSVYDSKGRLKKSFGKQLEHIHLDIM